MAIETWDVAKKGTALSLSNADQRASVDTTGAGNVAATIALPGSGKPYWEFYVEAVGGGSASMYLGVKGPSASNLETLGGVSVTGSGLYVSTGSKQMNAGSDTAFGSAWATAGKYVGVAIDIATLKIWFSLDGVWQASGDPAAGTNEAGILNVGGGYACFSHHTNRDGTRVKINLGGPFKYPVPSGFSALGDVQNRVAKDTNIQAALRRQVPMTNPMYLRR